MMKVKKLSDRKIEIIVVLFSLIFSTVLMFLSLSYGNSEIQVGSKAWSDFASHIPLIRSFSFGLNFPPEYPLFSGEPIKYHFLFYAFVGLLERVGVRIDYALNIPSIIGFAALIFMIYKMSILLFNSIKIAVLSIVLFLFNGSLGFIFFLKENPLSNDFILKIITNKEFPSFGPYDGNIVSAFWNLNIYTNQRHFGLSLAISLLIIYLLIKPIEEEKKQKRMASLAIGSLLGLTFLLNMAVFFMTVIVLIVLLVIFNKKAKNILISLIPTFVISFPLYLYFQGGGSSSISFSPGYLIRDFLTVKNFIEYWFFNLGLHTFLIPLGFILALKKTRKIFFAFFSLFIIANLFQFSPEIAANHKFFNYFMIIGVMFTSFALVSMWNKAYVLKILVSVLIFFLTFSGVIDLFPIINDTRIGIEDSPRNKAVEWIRNNTDPKSVFLNSEYIYTQSSLAGRRIFLGWPYFAWSQGYDTERRDNIRKKMLNETNIINFCSDALRYNISYVELEEPSEIKINYKFFDKELDIRYESDNGYYLIYSTDKCRFL